MENDKLREAWIEKMREIVDNDPFAQILGIEILEFEPGFARARFPMKYETTNNFGSVHGGALYAVADIMAGAVSCAEGKFSPTVEGHMNYLEAAKDSQYLYCEAKKVRGGSHLVVVKVKIKNEAGRLVDDGSFTFYRSSNDVISDADE